MAEENADVLSSGHSNVTARNSLICLLPNTLH
jgi:hypothetical protein